jgi:hypothetical protein
MVALGVGRLLLWLRNLYVLGLSGDGSDLDPIPDLFRMVQRAKDI